MLIKTYLPDEPLAPNILLPHQVHGNRIVEIITGEEDLSDCDGLWTHAPLSARGAAEGRGDRNSFKLGIRTADCAPIAFWNHEKYGILHCGWRGLCNGIVEKMLGIFDPNLRTQELKNLTTSSQVTQFSSSSVLKKNLNKAPVQEERLNMFVGPLLPSFEIQKDFCYEQLYKKFGDQFFTESAANSPLRLRGESKGGYETITPNPPLAPRGGSRITFHFRNALSSLFPPNAHIEWDQRNTFKTPELASWRRDHDQRRNVMVIANSPIAGSKVR